MNIDGAVNIADLRAIAKRTLPKILFDWVDGRAEDEFGLRQNVADFTRHKLIPRYLVDVGKRPQSVSLFSKTYSGPFGIAPAGFAGLLRRDGDLHLAKAAAGANIPLLCLERVLPRWKRQPRSPRSYLVSNISGAPLRHIDGFDPAGGRCGAAGACRDDRLAGRGKTRLLAATLERSGPSQFCTTRSIRL
jgi:FMN-dependent dehydrogenase